MNDNSTQTERIGYRNILAIVVLVFSIAGISILAAISIIKGADVQTVMTAVLPLFGSWVGTILAYYFSKENFEAATRSVAELAKQVTPQEKLKAVSVKAKMIPRDKMHVEIITPARPPGKINLTELLKNLDAADKGRRIPFLNENDFPLFIIHRSLIDKFLADNALSSSPKDAATLTLEDILNDAELKKRVDKSFVLVGENATLADAKQAMDEQPDCQDVFVTRSGNANDKVLGWITNVIIEDNAKI